MISAAHAARPPHVIQNVALGNEKENLCLTFAVISDSRKLGSAFFSFDWAIRVEYLFVAAGS